MSKLQEEMNRIEDGASFDDEDESSTNRGGKLLSQS